MTLKLQQRFTEEVKKITNDDERMQSTDSNVYGTIKDLLYQKEEIKWKFQ